MNISTRAARQARIVELVQEHEIASQGELRLTLAEEGINVTQATLSRDLEELHARKELNGSGKRVYRIPNVLQLAQADTGAIAQLNRWARAVMVSAAAASNQVVLRTPPGAAQLLASAVDRAVLDGVLGCIAGDDTVLVLTKNELTANSLLARLVAMANTAKETTDKE